MKTTYHPAIIIAFYLNCLPVDLQRYISRSTRFDWQHKDKSTCFGYEWFCQNQQLFQTLRVVSANKRLLQINRALIRIIAIKRLITNYADSAACFNISTFYKYVNLLSLKRSGVTHRRKHHHTGIRANAPLQIIHADVTVFRTADNHKYYIHLIQDNFSRAILKYAVKSTCLAQTTFENLKYVYDKHLAPGRLDICQLISDDGSENYGPVKAFTESSQYPTIQHVIAQRDIEFSNSMIEAANKQLKYRFLYHHHIADYDALVKYVEQSANDYNNRPHHVLHGLSPNEVLQGQTPNPHAYATRIQHAKANRLTENKKSSAAIITFDQQHLILIKRVFFFPTIYKSINLTGAILQFLSHPDIRTPYCVMVVDIAADTLLCKDCGGCREKSQAVMPGFRLCVSVIT